MIRTPTDFTAYLHALGLQIPDVEQVITGEGSRQEESTLAKAVYPQILIETPEAGIPASADQKTLHTRLYVLAKPQGTSHAREDQATDRAYRIAEAYVSAVRAHGDSEEHGWSLISDRIEISPVIARGSDQVRGWTFDLGIMIDQSCSTWDADTFFMPQFSVAVDGDPGAPTITITDSSIGSGAETDMWWREEIGHAMQTVQELDDDTITLSATDPESTYRVVHIWLRMVRGGITLWSYARVHSADTGGMSVPFIPHYPV